MDVTAAAMRISSFMPDQQTVTLYSRQSGDTFAAGVAWQAQRVLPAGMAAQDVADAAVARERAAWRLFLTAGQSVTPQEGDRIVDAGSTVWEVDSVEARMGRNIHYCDCTKDVSAGALAILLDQAGDALLEGD